MLCQRNQGVDKRNARNLASPFKVFTRNHFMRKTLANTNFILRVCGWVVDRAMEGS